MKIAARIKAEKGFKFDQDAQSALGTVVFLGFGVIKEIEILEDGGVAVVKMDVHKEKPNG